jgi:hypothetical protein
VVSPFYSDGGSRGSVSLPKIFWQRQIFKQLIRDFLALIDPYSFRVRKWNVIYRNFVLRAVEGIIAG